MFNTALWWGASFETVDGVFKFTDNAEAGRTPEALVLQKVRRLLDRNSTILAASCFAMQHPSDIEIFSGPFFFATFHHYRLGHARRAVVGVQSLRSALATLSRRTLLSGVVEYCRFCSLGGVRFPCDYGDSGSGGGAHSSLSSHLSLLIDSARMGGVRIPCDHGDTVW